MQKLNHFLSFYHLIIFYKIRTLFFLILNEK